MKLGIIHTSAVSLNDLKSLCKEIIPDVEVINIIDDSLLEEVKKNNGPTPSIFSRMCTYTTVMDKLGVDLVLNQCSSVGEAFDVARTCTKAKTLKIDEPMAEKALSIGDKIAVIATVASTIGPSCRLVERTAEKMGKSDAKVDGYLVDGALDILMKEGDQEKHNQLCLEMINKVADDHDVIILAQGSMTVLLPYIGDVKTPILTSPRLAIERVKEMLQG